MVGMGCHESVETIFALSTAAGRAGVAVVRVSGPRAYDVVTQIAGPLPSFRRAVFRSFRHPSSKELIDEGLLICFPEGGSFTGERSVEFQGHGGRATVAGILSAIRATGQARLAHPGEFTMRAMENGRIDLVQVEAMADLIDADTEAQRQQAVRALSGVLAERVQNWRSALLFALAQLSVAIDFSDEDVPEDVYREVVFRLNETCDDIEHQLRGAAAAQEVRDGMEVAIIGPPNSGKSTLLNYLAGRDVAITSEIAGTTRDVLEVRLDVDGCAVLLLDTAGVRETGDYVESIGVERTLKRAATADLRVFLVEGTRDLEELGLEPGDEDLVVGLKGDLQRSDLEYDVSGVTGLGVDRLLGDLGKHVASRTSGASLIFRERQRAALEDAVVGLRHTLECLREGDDLIDFAVDELRGVVRVLDVLVGRIDVEDVLGDIFSRFCLGK